MFNGTYTIENSKDGAHRTFSVRTQKADAKFAPGKRIVSLLSGPDNTSDYQGFGFLEGDKVSVWRSKRGTPVKPSAFDAYALMLASLGTLGEKSKWFERGYRIRSSCTCIRCNRKLTTPESVKTGIGPECAEKMGFDRESMAKAFDAAERGEALPPTAAVVDLAATASPEVIAALPKEYDIWSSPTLRGAIA